MQDKRYLIAALVVGALAQSASAQFNVNWFTLDGGGGTSAGGIYSLSGTIGQADASAVMSGGSFELTGGFWPGLSSACLGDLTGDGKIDQADLGVLLSAYGTCPGQPGYNSAAGLLAPADPCVNQADLGVLLAVYGTTCP